MFRSTNVPFDECSIRRMFHSTNVPFDECSIRRMFRSTNVPFDQCSFDESAFDESVCDESVVSPKITGENSRNVWINLNVWFHMNTFLLFWINLNLKQLNISPFYRGEITHLNLFKHCGYSLLQFYRYLILNMFIK